MATSKKADAQDAVNEFIKKLKPSLAETVEAIRQIVLGCDKEIAEQIKWNSPSFYYAGEMKTFNAKEYKRDLVVIHLRNGYPLLIFPTGDQIKDDSGLLEGDYKDGRWDPLESTCRHASLSIL